MFVFVASAAVNFFRVGQMTTIGKDSFFTMPYVQHWRQHDASVMTA